MGRETTPVTTVITERPYRLSVRKGINGDVGTLAEGDMGAFEGHQRREAGYLENPCSGQEIERHLDPNDL